HEELQSTNDDEAIGAHLLSFDIGLPVERLASPIHTCLAAPSTPHYLVLDAHNRKGQDLRCHVRCHGLVRGAGEALGVILTMAEDRPTN
ncbi:MAG: CheR family methyltransferase, partial [Egibacteraceae bacterium]